MSFLDYIGKFTTQLAAAALIFFFFWIPLSLIFSVLAIVFGVAGLIAHKKKRLSGNRLELVVGTVLGFILLFTSLFSVFGPIMESDDGLSNLLLGNCEELPKESSSRTHCIQEKAINNNDVSICNALSGDYYWLCIREYASHTNNTSLCLEIPKTTEGNLAYVQTNCLIDVVISSQNETICEYINKNETYTDSMSSYDECMYWVN